MSDDTTREAAPASTEPAPGPRSGAGAVPGERDTPGSTESRTGRSDPPGATTRTPPATPGGGDAPGGTGPEPAGGTTGGGAEATGGGSGDAPRKRRRRGSRGGRNRKRKPPAVSADDAADRRPGSRAEDYTDPAADRGMTADDVAEKAAIDAGISKPRIGDSRPAPAGSAPARPRIGDSRPAPSATSAGGAPKVGDRRPAAPAGGGESGEGRDGGNGGNGPGNGPGGGAPAGTGTSRRRRRGGQGRSRSGGGGGAGPDRPAVTPVEADLGLDAAVELDEAVIARRRGRTRKGRPAGRYMMCVHAGPGPSTQIAVLEGRNLVEHSVARPEDDAASIDGNIYLGRVQNVLPGMEAAFVDIGTAKNAVLYRGDVVFDESEIDEKQPRIETLLKNGQSILVQVTKNPIGHKGARLTQEVSLAGRFLVLVPNQPDTYGISKRLPDDERRRLRQILDQVRGGGAGVIVRTAAEGATADELVADFSRLMAQWSQIEDLAARSRPGTLLYKEPPLVVRRIREEFTKEYRAVVIDDRELYERVHGYVSAIAPELAERIEHYDPEAEQLPIFERFHVHEQLHKALDRKVWLPSGGSLIIERTEALTVIDVNTGKNVGKSNLEETVFANNLEAADEVARQLRLRDIGGIIVIDFIDMEVQKNRDDVLAAFKAALARDKTRTQVFDISELGLVEMTRKRISEGLVEAFSEKCEVCKGRGFVVDESMLS
ncbi:MAG: Rne/Rng family ribonuclease [Acidimicrobiia bacterium]|nr:Rne/Rng family ribonuclease [Acidimicrobiia bacterium]